MLIKRKGKKNEEQDGSNVDILHGWPYDLGRAHVHHRM